MTHEEALRQAEVAARLSSAYDALSRAETHLRLINEHVKKRTVWEASLIIKRGDGYGSRDVTITVPIEGGYVQQQAVNAVTAAKRKVVLLGGAA